MHRLTGRSTYYNKHRPTTRHGLLLICELAFNLPRQQQQQPKKIYSIRLCRFFLLFVDFRHAPETRSLIPVTASCNMFVVLPDSAF